MRENELLTFWEKPHYKPLAKQLEDESNLYKIPSMRPGKHGLMSTLLSFCLAGHNVCAGFVKSWNFRIAFSRLGKLWHLGEGHGKLWKIRAIKKYKIN